MGVKALEQVTEVFCDLIATEVTERPHAVCGGHMVVGCGCLVVEAWIQGNV